LKNEEGVMNIPLKGNEPAVDALAPYDGYMFQVSVSRHKHVSRKGLESLMDTGIFNDFVQRQKRKRKNVALVFIVEAALFDKFQRQEYHDPNKQPYALNSSLRHSYTGVTQFAFEIDLRRIYTFEEHQKNKEIVNMTEEARPTFLEKVVQKFRTN
jgi:hypothetical protein